MLWGAGALRCPGKYPGWETDVLYVYGHKGPLWEGGLRVPLIVRGPGVPTNSFCDVPVVGYDFFPTFCDLAGVQASLPEGTEGGRLSHLFRGASKYNPKGKSGRTSPTRSK